MGRKKKAAEPEYRLRMFYHQFDRKPHASLVISVETTKEFSSFQYEVVLDHKVSGGEVLLRILGLHAPQSAMPGVGPARGFRVFDDLKGKYRIRIAKPDGDENVVVVRIGDATLKLLEADQHAFVSFSTEPFPIPE